MWKHKSHAGQMSSVAFQEALDDLSVVGTWELDATSHHARVDAFVAMLFGVDPPAAAVDLPLATVINGIHADDRDRVSRLIDRALRQGGPYVAEYRVRSVDGATRWVLSRGRFYTDQFGRPLRGRGVIIDITRARAAEDAHAVARVDTPESPLDQAAEHAIATQKAVTALNDPALQALADALLLGLGRALARREVQARSRRMN